MTSRRREWWLNAVFCGHLLAEAWWLVLLIVVAAVVLGLGLEALVGRFL